MKKHITIKEAKRLANYGVGYCNLQYLFNCLEPFAYTATNTYGWRSDLYHVGGVVISTGYAPQGESIPYELTQKYENLAMKVINDNPDYHNRKDKLDKLIDEFLAELEA